jgi:hypothetical protein
MENPLAYGSVANMLAVFFAKAIGGGRYPTREAYFLMSLHYATSEWR